MTREELFLAIGQLEESRLARSEISVQAPKKGKNKIFRNLLVAAVIISMLGLTACAVVGYVLFDSPQEMIGAVFGDQTGFDHKGITVAVDPEKPEYPYEIPAYDRVPADTKVVEAVTPYVSPVGKSITFHGVTLTVDSYLYDSTTQCGVVAYSLYYPDGVPKYRVGDNGYFSFDGEPTVCATGDYYGYDYIIQDKTSDTVLALRYYFKYDRWQGNGEELNLRLHYQAPENEEDTAKLKNLRTDYTPEEAMAKVLENYGEEYFESYAEQFRAYGEIWRTEAAYWLLYEMLSMENWDPGEDSEKIILDVSRSSELGSISLGSGGAFVSPISLQIEAKKIDFLLEADYPSMVTVDSLIVRFTDGTEYVIVDQGVENLMFWRCSPSNDTPEEDLPKNENTQMTVMFNRMIDVDKVESIVVNGIEIKAD